MARTLSSALHIARHKLWDVQGWYWFVQIEGLSGRMFRLVRSTEALHANGFDWQRADFTVQLAAEDGQGALGDLVVRLPNVGRVAMAYIESEGELLGRPLTVYCQHASGLAAFAADMAWRHVIDKADATALTVDLTASHAANAIQVPRPIFDRSRFPQLLPGQGVGVGGGA